MTKLERRIKRIIPNRRRDLVVILHPAAEPYLELREKGRRTGFSITIAALYVVLAQRAVEAAITRREADLRHRRRR